MKSWIIIGALVAVLGGSVYLYYTSTQNRIQTLTIENIASKKDLEIASLTNAQNVKTIDDIQKENQRVVEDFNRVNGEYQNIREQNKRLQEKLGRHELDALAAAKPVLVERILNNASDKALRCFELMSGAPWSDSEKLAKSGKQFNSECPWIWDDMVKK